MRFLWFQKWIRKSNLANYDTRFHKIMWFSFDIFFLGLNFRTLFSFYHVLISLSKSESFTFNTFFDENFNFRSKWHPFEIYKKRVTSMLVTDVGDKMCWWQVWDVDDRFRMLVTDLIHWENHLDNEKSR